MDKCEWETRIEEVFKTIYSYCVVRTAGRADAEDLAQDILLELTKALPNLRDEQAFYGFMWSVAGNVYKQWCRKDKQSQTIELTEDIPSEKDKYMEVTDEDSEYQRLRRELALLSRKYRDATVLYYVEEKSCSEIAQILNISESMVKYLLFKSRKLLKEGMSMERIIGEQSYNPRKLGIRHFGDSSTYKLWNLIQGSRIRQNILWACNFDRLNSEQIALQIGVSLPYMEDDLEVLTEVGLLLKEGNYYQTNIIILSNEFHKEVDVKLESLKRSIANKIKAFAEENMEKVREVGFYKCDMSRNSLKWQIASMLQMYAFKDVTEYLYHSGSIQEFPFGEGKQVWCEEEGGRLDAGGFNVCVIDAEEWNTDISMYFMDWLGHPQSDHADFYGSKNWIKVYSKLAHDRSNFSHEMELEIVAEMIRKGYAYKDGDRIRVTMPVFTKEEYKRVSMLLEPAIQEVKELMIEAAGKIAKVMVNHVPTHLKKQVNGIAAMDIWHQCVYLPFLLLIEEDFLSLQWKPLEMASCHVVLADV